MYREDLPHMIRELTPLGQIVIISDSNPEVILSRLTPYLEMNSLEDTQIRVIGNAGKTQIYPAWRRIHNDRIFLPGLARPIWTRRKIYGEHILSFAQLPYAAASDSGELDLVVPMMLEVQLNYLMVNRLTPEWEKGFFQNVHTLDEVTNKILVSHGK